MNLNFQLPWEKEEVKRIIEVFQCKVISLEPIEEVGNEKGSSANQPPKN